MTWTNLLEKGLFVELILAAACLAGCQRMGPPDAIGEAHLDQGARFPMSAGFTDGSEFSTSRRIAPGISHRFVSDAEEPLTMNIVEVDTSLPDLEIETEAAEDRLRVRETVPSMVARNWDPKARPLVATNGGFWGRDNMPIGMFVDEGMIWQSPWKGRGEDEGKTRSVYAFDGQGNHFIGLPEVEMGLYNDEGERVLIDRVNYHMNSSYGTAYTWPHGDETRAIREGQSQIVLNLPGGEWLPNKPAPVVVDRIDKGPSAEIGRETVVIHADDPLPAWVEEGARLELRADFAGLPGTVTHCVGGVPRLLVNGVADPIAYAEEEGIRPNFVTDKHPRTAVGIKEDGKTVVLAVVDGRQTGRSSGINLMDLAEQMKDLGCVEAINLDGGGSSTMVVNDELVNFPSDFGGPRAVGNGLIVRRTAPLGGLDSLVLTPSNVTLPTGGTIALHVAGRDTSGERIEMEQPIEFRADPDGLVSFDGSQITALEPGKVEIEARPHETKTRSVSGKAFYTLADPAVLEFEPSALLLDVGDEAEVILNSRTADGEDFYANTMASDVTVPEFLEYDQNARRVRALEEGGGRIILRMGGAAPAVLNVGVETYEKTPAFGFELSPGEGMAGELRLINASEQSSVTRDTVRVKEGDASWKFSYDMERGGVTLVGIPFDLELPGEPLEAGLWVYGDGLGQWMRGDFEDSAGHAYKLEFTTAQEGIGWDGWRFIRASLRNAPATTGGAPAPVPPFTIKSIYIAQPQEAAKRDGAVWFDGLVAINLPQGLQ